MSREGSQLEQAEKKKKLFTLKVFTAGNVPTGTWERWEITVMSQLSSFLENFCLLFVCLFNFSDESEWVQRVCVFLIWWKQSLKN